MRISLAGGRRPHLHLRTSCALGFLAVSLAEAISFTAAPPANLDLSQLGRIGIAGDFSGISLWEFEEQSERIATAGGAEPLLAQLPNGALAPVLNTDASINAMCTLFSSGGDLRGVVLGGNFTSLDGRPSQGIAILNPATDEITQLEGLSGKVNALLCDRESNRVYVGGNFIGDNSANAIAWVVDEGWADLPFAGFNGPVTSITKASNGHVIFGGSFTGLGNATLPTTLDGQIINLSDAEVTSGSTTETAGFDDPRAVFCSSGADGAGSTWLLEDQSPGFLQARFQYWFMPSKLRLWNTHQEGRGTRTWRYTALPLNGIMNFTYTDPATGQNATCTSECPLSDDPAVQFQDFHFVNVVGMDEFRIDVSAFYGNGGGFNKIELYSNDIYSYAVNTFNEPTCAGNDLSSTATATGPWTESPSLLSNSRYLTALLTADTTPEQAEVVFFPDIVESGNYSVNIYTPGCQQDATCETRGQVNVTGYMSSGTVGPDFTTPIFQSNNFDKYDQIFFGFVDAGSASFRPRITLAPLPGAVFDNMTIVAQRVGFTLINSTGGLKGLFDFDPDIDFVDSGALQDSAVNRLGSDFDGQSAVSALVTAGDVTYVAGNFSSASARSIVAINTANDEVTPVDGGIDGEVVSMHLDGSRIFVGGDFANGMTTQVEGLVNIGVYDTEVNTWSAIGGGVDARVDYVIPMRIPIDGGSRNESVVAFTGSFTQCLAFGDNTARSVDGFAIWVPSQNNWLHNLDLAAPSYTGALTASVLDLPSGEPLLAGSIASSQIGANGAATLGGDGLGKFSNVNIEAAAADAAADASSDIVRRDTALESDVRGVITGAFFTRDGDEYAVLAGHFSTTDSNNNDPIQNIAIVRDSGDSTTVTGLGEGISEDSTFVTVFVRDNTLYAGGRVSGTINDADVVGLVSFDLGSSGFNDQPPALSPTDSTVSAITAPQDSDEIYVAGSFHDAGSLSCPAVCLYSTSLRQWNRPGVNLDGTAHCMRWTSQTDLVVGGDLRVNVSETAYLVSFNTESRTWVQFPGADAIPGPVEVLTPASSDSKQLWVSGSASDGSQYLMKYDGQEWKTAPPLGEGSIVQSLQVFSLTENHNGNEFLDENQALMLTGSIVIPHLGTASAAIFNGTALRPYALTAGTGNGAGTIAKIFSETQNFFSAPSGGLAVGFIVLIGLAIALGLVLLLIVIGIIVARIRRRREGYTPAPTSMIDRGTEPRRIPPHELLQSLGQPRPGAPHV